MEKEKKKALTLKLSEEDYKSLAKYCIDHDIKHQEFLEFAAMYCVEKNLYPKQKKG